MEVMNMTYRIIAGIEPLSYITNSNHHFIGNPNLQATIGKNGSNLTIVILSLNRSYLTINLLSSIEKHISSFEGRVLIMDNGSNNHTITDLETFLKSYSLSCDLVKLNTNYGVASGRNKSLSYVNTDWLMFLDNDIYFLDNPLPNIHYTINQLGCHFLNLPLLDNSEKKLYALGGHLELSNFNNALLVECTSAYLPSSPVKTKLVPPFLSTFLFGGASVLRKDTFIQLGTFDENMFVGYEDIDLSIRIYNAGLKIGNCGQICLVHNHIINNSDDIQSYERIRSSGDILSQSASYIEHKYDILVRKHNKSEISVTEESNSNFEVLDITFVVNDLNDYFFVLASQLKDYLSKIFNTNIIVISELNHVSEILLLTQHSKLVHFFDRTSILSLPSLESQTFLSYKGVNQIQYINLIKQIKISTGITDFQFLRPMEIQKYLPIFKLISYYYVSSNELNEIYTHIPQYPNPSYVIYNEEDFFSLKFYFAHIFGVSL